MATARLEGDWTNDLDAVQSDRGDTIQLADLIAGAVVSQFPDKFGYRDNYPPPGGRDDEENATVTMTDENRFEPRSLVVDAGTLIRWENRSRRPHSVSVDRANRNLGGPDSDLNRPNGVEPGDYYVWRVPMNANRGSRWYYHCRFHGQGGSGDDLGPGMSGVIIVR